MTQIFVRNIKEFKALSQQFQDAVKLSVSLKTDTHIALMKANRGQSALSAPDEHGDTIIIYFVETLCGKSVLQDYALVDTFSKNKVECPLCLVKLSEIQTVKKT